MIIIRIFRGKYVNADIRRKYYKPVKRPLSPEKQAKLDAEQAKYKAYNDEFPFVLDASGLPSHSRSDRCKGGRSTEA